MSNENSSHFWQTNLWWTLLHNDAVGLVRIGWRRLMQCLFPWQLFIHTTETDSAIKMQDLKGSMCHRSPQIYWASDWASNIFLAASRLIPVNHSPLLVKTGALKWGPGSKGRRRGYINRLFFLVVMLPIHLIWFSLLHSCACCAPNTFVGQRKLKRLKWQSKGCTVSVSNFLF